MSQSGNHASQSGGGLRSMWVEHIAPAVVADSLQKATGYGIGASTAALGSLLSWAFQLSYWLLAASALLAVVLTVPALVGFKRSRQRKRLEDALAKNKKLTKLAKSSKRQLKDLARRNEDLEHSNREMKSLVREMQRREEGNVKVAQVLADLLRAILGKDEVPTPPWAQGPLQFERWLCSFTGSVVRVILQCPDKMVGLAIVRERDNKYEFVYRTSDIPKEILALEPAPVIDDLEPCMQRHAPHACALPGPTIDGDPHWVAVFPQHPVDRQFTRAPLRAATELIMAAYVRHQEVAGA